MTNTLGAKPVIDTGEFKSKIGEMNRELRVLESGFKASAAGLGNWAKDATGLESRMKSLNSQIDLQRKKVDLTRIEYEKVKKEKGANSKAAQDLEIKLNKETETLGKMELELRETDRALGEVKKGSVDAGKGIDKLGKDSAAASKRMETMKGVVAGMTKALKAALAAVLAVVAALGALAVGAFKSGQTLEKAYNTIIIGTGATGAALDGLKDDFNAVFKRVPVDADTAAVAISELNTRLGLSGEELQDVTVSLLEMTRMLGGDVKTNAALFSRVIGDWGVPLEESELLLDKLFKASQATGIGVDSLMTKVVQFGAPMRLMNFSIDESLALFAQWERDGVNAELVMGSLRIAAGKFAKDGRDLADGLWETVEAIKNAGSESEALSIAMEVFGARAGPDMAASILEGRFEVQNLIDALQNAEGAIGDTAAATLNFDQKMQLFKNKVTTVLGPIGIQLLDVAESLIDAIAEIFESPAVQEGIENIAMMLEMVADVIKQIAGGDAQGGLARIFGAENSAKLLKFFGDVRKFVQETLLPFIRDHSKEIKAALIGIGVALAAAGIITAIVGIVSALNPVTLIIAAIVAAVALLSAAWAGNWGGIQDKVAAVWAFLEPIFSAIKEWLGKTIPEVLGQASAVWQGVLLPAIQTVWQFLSGSVFPLFQAIGKFVGSAFSLVFRALAALWQGVLLPALRAVYAYLDKNVFPVLRKVSDFVSKTLQPVFSGLAGFFTGTLIPAFRGIADVVEWIVEWLLKLTDVLDNIQFPSMLTPGSPTPFETGLVGIQKAMKKLNGEAAMLKRNMQMGGAAFMGLSAAPIPQRADGGRQSTHNRFDIFGNVIVQGSATPDSFAANLKAKRI